MNATINNNLPILSSEGGLSAYLEQIKKLNKTYFDLKMKHASLALKETHKLSETRKDIARIKTQMNQEKRATENE